MLQLLTVLLVSMAFAAIAAERARANGDRFDVRLASGAVALATASAAFAWLDRRPLPASLLFALPLATVSAATDASCGYIYDAILIPAAGGVLALALCGGALGSVLFAGVFLAALSLAVRWIARNNGLGLGDVKLFAVLGGAFGTHAALMLFGASFVLGALVAIPLVIFGAKSRGTTLPFAPMIACAALGVAWGGIP